MTRVLVLQLGHCYRTRGATGTPGEQDFATRVGKAAKRLLEGRGGWRVRLVLADDRDRVLLAGDAFVAIHADGSTNPTVGGASTGFRNAAGRDLAAAFLVAYHRRGWTGGFKPSNYTEDLRLYYGTGDAIAAGNERAIIVEAGYLTHPADRAALTGPLGADRVALAIGDALGIPTTPTIPEQPREDDDVTKFVQGDGPRPWSDYVFKVTYPDQYGPIAVRTHVPNPDEPGFRVARATGAGMNPQTGEPWRVPQRDLDRIPFATPVAQQRYADVATAAGHPLAAPEAPE